jgi:hypothetical protein
MIFDWCGDGGRSERRIAPTPKAFASMRSIGITCGRLHVADALGEFTDPETLRFRSQTMARLHRAIDGAVQHDITVMMQFGLDSRKSGIHSEDPQERLAGIKKVLRTYLITWEQCSIAFKDKSYLFAMAPFIEFHTFRGVFAGKRQKALEGGLAELVKEFSWLEGAQSETDATNKMYDHMIRIYRKHNPKRIMGFKAPGVGAPRFRWPKGVDFAKLGYEEHVEIPADKRLTFPYGDDPDTTYQIAIMPMSHTARGYWDWGINSEKSNEHIVRDSQFTPNAVAAWRDRKGLEVFNDHGYWARRKAGIAEKKPKNKNREIRQLTVKQSAIGLRDILVWSARNRIPFAAVQIRSFLNLDGSLVSERDLAAVEKDIVSTEGLSGKELQTAQEKNQRIKTAIANRRSQIKESLAIIGAYREAAAIVGSTR